MSATAFQRMRREAAIKIAEEDNNITEDECYKKQLTEMTLEELIEYAEKNDIDIGKATSKTGILEKIIKAQTE